MPKSLSREEFLQNLSDSGLFSQEELGHHLDALPDPPPADGKAVAERLIAAGNLTPFQAEAVSERRFEQLVIGNYQVLGRLGAGGMGTVYKARHRRMKRVVAIKVLSRTAGQAEQFLPRFQREVEAVARLSHPNIVMAHDADEAPAGHYLVMEFVNGRDLATEVQQRGPLPVREAVAYTAQAARALAYAHGQGIIHRDIKPANLLLDAAGLVKVADLGLARFNDTLGRPAEEASALTQAGTIMGTVDFMSPEQALGLTTIDHRADVYSLGCTLYFLLLARPPYQGPTMMATLLKHREGPIPSPAAVRAEVPAEVDAVFKRMVAKAPADRYQTMAEVVAALEAAEAALGDRSAAAPAGTVLLTDGPDTGLSTGVWEGQTKLAAPVEAPSHTVELKPPASPRGGPLKVLLVEPSRTQSGIIRKYLQAHGLQDVVAVASGQEALAVVRGDPPDAVVSALHLKDMTGVQLAQQLHGEKKGAAPGFVLTSSEAEKAEVGTLSKCGKAVLLQKPFTSDKLVEALRLVSAAPPPPAPPAAGRGLRALVVDDSAPARLHVQGVLAGLGVSHLVAAADGAQAVAAVAREAFDLIVTDYNMPFLDGRGLVGYLKQNPATAAVPIIMVTTEQDPTKLDAVRQLGVAAVCDKSFPPEVVRPILDRLVKTP
jgi:serine/threonine protein kinase/DNA-binding response OmpR family regulator